LKIKAGNFLKLLFFISGLFLITSCQSGTSGPTELLNKYFDSAMKQDYATTYTCYYEPYQAKVSKEEFVRHRKEASVLQSYKILSIKMIDSNSAEAEVQLTFGPSAKLNRKEPVTTNLKEEMIKEKGEWKIKVW
jgi:hypothetical protein